MEESEDSLDFDPEKCDIKTEQDTLELEVKEDETVDEKQVAVAVELPIPDEKENAEQLNFFFCDDVTQDKTHHESKMDLEAEGDLKQFGGVDKKGNLNGFVHDFV